MARIRDQVVAGVQDVKRDEIRAKYREEHGQAIKNEVRIEINREAWDTMRQRIKAAPARHFIKHGLRGIGFLRSLGLHD